MITEQDKARGITAEFMAEAWKMQIKDGLTHMITDMYVQEASDEEVKEYLDECKTKCVSIGKMEDEEASRFVREAHNEAKMHIAIFAAVTKSGMGRQTTWLDLTLEHLAGLKLGVLK